MGDSPDAGVSGLQYLGPDPQIPGGHLVQTPDGVVTLPHEGLTPGLQYQAATYDPSGGFNGGQSDPPPQQGPASATPAQLQALQGTSTPYDPAAQTALTPDQDKALGSQGVGLTPAQVTPPASNAGTAAAVPVPAAVGFQPPAAATPPPAAPPPTTGGGGGGGPPPGTKAAMAVYGQEAQDKAGAIKAQGQADTDLSKSQLDIGKANSEQQAAQLVQRQAMEQQTQQQVQELLQRSKSVADQFSNAKIDPQSYWKNMSTGDHLLAAGSMILSGIGAGLAGQQNLAVKHFEDAVNNDIAAQRFNIEHGKDVSEQYSKLAQDFQAAGLSRRQALDATDLSIKNKAITDQANAAFANGGEQAAAKMKLALAPLTADVMDKTQKHVEDVVGTKLKQAQTVQSYAAAAKDKAEAAATGIKGANAQWANQVGGPDGSVGVAASPEAVKDFNTEAKPAQDLQAAIGEVDAIRKQGKAAIIANQGRLKVLSGRIKQSAAELGGMKEGNRTEQILDAMTGDPSQVVHILPGSDYDQHSSELKNIANTTIKNAGARHRIQWIRPPAAQIQATPVG